MFKRVIWMGVGAAAGSAATVWGQRKVKHQVEQIQQMATPAHVMDVAKTKATDIKDRVVTAVSEGIAETREIEAELRANLPGAAAVPKPLVDVVPDNVTDLHRPSAKSAKTSSARSLRRSAR